MDSNPTHPIAAAPELPEDIREAIETGLENSEIVESNETPAQIATNILKELVKVWPSPSNATVSETAVAIIDHLAARFAMYHKGLIYMEDMAANFRNAKAELLALSRASSSAPVSERAVKGLSERLRFAEADRDREAGKVDVLTQAMNKVRPLDMDERHELNKRGTIIEADKITIDGLRSQLATAKEERDEARSHLSVAELEAKTAHQEIAALRSDLAKAKADGERLDWLLTGEQKVSPQVGWDGTQGEVRVMQARFASEDGAFQDYHRLRTRTAIDAARNAGGGT